MPIALFIALAENSAPVQPDSPWRMVLIGRVDPELRQPVGQVVWADQADGPPPATRELVARKSVIADPAPDSLDRYPAAGGDLGHSEQVSHADRSTRPVGSVFVIDHQSYG